jgi:hypothetical protein
VSRQVFLQDVARLFSDLREFTAQVAFKSLVSVAPGFEFQFSILEFFNHFIAAFVAHLE